MRTQRHPTRREEYDDLQGMLPHLEVGFADTTSPSLKEDLRDHIMRKYRDILDICPAADRPYWQERYDAFRNLEAQETAALMKTWRTGEQITQMEAATMTGIPVRTWQEWEQGRKPGPGVLLLRLAFETLTNRRAQRRAETTS